MRIYFAGPLFSASERNFNLSLVTKIETAGFPVYLPQRDSAHQDGPAFDCLTATEKQMAIFSRDRGNVLSSDIFLINLDGRVPDEGACVELGIASFQRDVIMPYKLLVGFMSDFRAYSLEARINPMLYGSLDCIVKTEDSLLELLRTYQETGHLDKTIYTKSID